MTAKGARISKLGKNGSDGDTGKQEILETHPSSFAVMSTWQHHHNILH
jgi:hypothetical protein